MNNITCSGIIYPRKFTLLAFPQTNLIVMTKSTKKSPKPNEPDNNPQQPRGPSLVEYGFRAATLDSSIYPAFRSKAELVLHSLGSVAVTGVSLSIWVQYSGSNPVPSGGLQSIYPVLVSFSTVMVGWMMWAFVAKAICNMMGSEIDFRSSMRSIGIAYSPGGFLVFASIPFIGSYLFLIVSIWLLATITRAISAANNVSLMKAIIPGFLGWLMSWILLMGWMVIYPFALV